MPLYDIECPSCGGVVKDHLAKADEALPSCPQCHVPYKKLPSHVSFAFGMPHAHASKMEWAQQRRTELEKRSNDFDKTPRGRNIRNESIARAYGLGKKG